MLYSLNIISAVLSTSLIFCLYRAAYFITRRTSLSIFKTRKGFSVIYGKGKSFFTDFRTQLGVSQTVKLQRLCRAAGIADIDFEGKFVAVKMHFGELGNCAYLRPNYVRAVTDIIRELGGKPFLTDCNTLYRRLRI